MGSKIQQLLIATREVMKHAEDPYDLTILGQLAPFVADAIGARITITPLEPVVVKDERFARWEIALHDKRSHTDEHVRLLRHYRDELRRHVATELGIPVEWIHDAGAKAFNLFGLSVWLRDGGFFELLRKRTFIDGKAHALPDVLLGVTFDELLLIFDHGVHHTEEAAAKLPGP